MRPALFLAVLVVAGCTREAPAARQLSSIEYRWGPNTPDASWTAIDSDSFPDEPPGRVGDELWVRVRLPRVEARVPSVALRFAFGLRSVQLEGRELFDRRQVWTVFPLPAAHEGGWLVQQYRSPQHLIVGDIRVGEHSELLDATTHRELEGAIMGAVLMLIGAVLALASLRRDTPREYPPFALFCLSLGTVMLAELFQLRFAIIAAPELWRVVHPIGLFLAPVGLLLFVRAVFGDTPRRLLAVGATVFVGLLAAAIVLHLTGLMQLAHSKRLPLALAVLAILAVLRVVAPVAWRGDLKARLFLGGWCVFGLAIVPRILSGLGLVSGAANTHLGEVSLIVSFGLLLVQKQREDAAELARRLGALEQKNREVETLNSELRRQVAERSRALATGAEASHGSGGGGAGFEPGSTFDGRYRILKKLGQGGMGAVFEVERLGDGTHLALKVMSRRAGLESARFFREAEIAARLSHPNLVSVVDVGVASGALYLVMELVDGVTLEACRPRFGEVAWARPLLRQLARGLAELHKRDVVHRDLKPANVLLSRQSDETWRVRIADFGLSRQGTAADTGDTLPPGAGGAASPAPAEPLTATGVMMGTPPYMAPELAHGARDAPASADVFAFGVTAYELLTGARPFAQVPVYEVLAGRPVPRAAPLRTRAELPPVLAHLIDTCLAADPLVRPSAETLEAALGEDLSPPK